MSPEDQNVAIAEACGSTVVRLPFVPNKIKPSTVVFTKDAAKEWLKAYPSSFAILVPDYLSDLNAIHTALATLRENEKEDFDNILAEDGEGGYAWEASAARLAEAFLRTKGVWK